MSWSSFPVEVELENDVLNSASVCTKQEAKGDFPYVVGLYTCQHTMVVFDSKLCYDKLTYPQW